jgi:hypothetical protein
MIAGLRLLTAELRPLSLVNPDSADIRLQYPVFILADFEPTPMHLQRQAALDCETVDISQPEGLAAKIYYAATITGSALVSPSVARANQKL